MIKKYTKNSIEVEALQYTGTQESMNEVLEWIGDRLIFAGRNETNPNFTLVSERLGREIVIYNNNWIIKDGQLWFVSSDDIFQTMYEEA